MPAESTRHRQSAWRELYLAALFEVDRGKLAERIAEAEKALIVRARELFQTNGDHIDEEYAMDDAMYALHALQQMNQPRVPVATSRAEAA